MLKRPFFVLLMALAAASSLSALPVIAQQGDSKRPLTHDDYDAWRRIQGQSISPNGEWVLYSANPQDGDGEIVVRNVERGTTRASLPRTWKHERGQLPTDHEPR